MVTVVTVTVAEKFKSILKGIILHFAHLFVPLQVEKKG